MARLIGTELGRLDFIGIEILPLWEALSIGGGSWALKPETRGRICQVPDSV